jgi:phytoene synthase
VSEPTTPTSRPEDLLLPALPQTMQLALAYAPSRAKLPTLALLALDQRLAGLLRHSREPMMAQIRLAWWRETLDRDAGEWPEGEPLLAALRSWNGKHRPLVSLVNGWEALTGEAPLAPSALEEMVDGRAAAFAGLATALDREGEAEVARILGRRWALADLSTKLNHPGESVVVRRLAQAEEGRLARVSRTLRPLAVLEGVARENMANGGQGSARTVLKAMRIGLLGR